MQCSPSPRRSHAVQIFILYLVFYSILKAARGSRFGQVLMGTGVLVTALAFFTFLFHFDVLQKILSGLLLYFALSTVVIFQQEIRRFLETLGALMKEDSSSYRLYAQERLTPEAFVDSVFHLAGKRLGALLAFERGISLRNLSIASQVLFGHPTTCTTFDILPFRSFVIPHLTLKYG